MKKILLLLVVILHIPLGYAQKKDNPIKFKLDLTNVQDDRLMVEMTAPKFSAGEVTYRFPKMIPGTYSIYDFGRFVKNLKAYDKNENELDVEREDVNSWKISDAKKLRKITYWVDDTFDSKDTGKFIFEPAGTNISKDNFVINTHGFFGYFDDMKDNEYIIDIIKPQGFYGATPLVAEFSDETRDEYKVNSYFTLVDSPMMYNIPDTTVINVSGTDVLISVFSPNKMVKSKFVAENSQKILEACANYLGGELPVKKYAFLYYFFSGNSGSGAAGALEHNNSSMYSLGEGMPQMVINQIKHTAAHEFFHIVTPLGIHSEEIGNFDYNVPKMSKHLWLYEGCTEYNAMIALARGGVYSSSELMGEIGKKIMTSKFFNDTLPFTEMSLQALGKHEKQYQNVYEKGALIGMCLDIKLRQLSGGSYGLIDLLNGLSKKYGAEKPFVDNELFDEIAAMTYPEIREFFAKYVEGSYKLPYNEFLSIVGVSYGSGTKEKGYSLGSHALNFDMKTKRIFIDSDDIDDFGKSIGLQRGDQFVKLNKETLEISKLQSIIENFFSKAKEGDAIEIEVARKDADGNEKLVTLKGKVMKTEKEGKPEVKLIKDPTDEQLRLRKAWMGS
ncbi:MAG: peptidase M61 [Ignavibacteria bacterium]|nr:peptidase M61 [Ignavibacteria bacterium]